MMFTMYKPPLYPVSSTNQEFFCVPVGAKTFAEAMKMASEVFHNLKSLIKKKYGQDACNVGDEGGFAPNIASNDEGLDLVNEAIKVWTMMGGK